MQYNHGPLLEMIRSRSNRVCEKCGWKECLFITSNYLQLRAQPLPHCYRVLAELSPFRLDMLFHSERTALQDLRNRATIGVVLNRSLD
jgi:hypothetical protein